MIYNSPAVERLGIRKYNWWNEALHGVARNGNATVFPMPIGMAASFDTELLEEVFTSISDEGRIKWGIARDANDQDMWYKGLSYWTPNINIFPDPRWGRGMESYGEDPYLTGQLGMAVVRGLQGPRDGENVVQLYVSRPDDAQGPIKTLSGYERVSLKAGESTEVRIPVDEETFLWWNPASGRMNPLAGEYLLHYGDTSDGDMLKTVKYTYKE